MSTLMMMMLFANAVLFLRPSEGAKILLIPANLNSHGLYFSKLGEGLAQLGHRVHIVAAGNGRIRTLNLENENENFTIREYEVEGVSPYANSKETSEAMIKLALSSSRLEQFSLLYSFGTKMLSEWENDCIHLLENEKVMKEIRSGGFDFAIMDPVSINCYYLIPYSLGIPYASMSISFAGWLFSIPRLPSFVSSLGYTDQMTFFERFSSFVADYAQLSMINSTTCFSEKYVPDKPPLGLRELFERSSLLFLIEDLALGYPRPHMPNTVALGDIMAQPPKPLPNDLKYYLGNATEGAIVVSFGSFFDHVPEFVVRRFCDAFRRIKYRVVWKLKDAQFCSGLKNVKTLPWIPQNDLLAHKNVRAFISHGGFNSIVESIYHAKPLIIFPIALDQPNNAVAAEHKGYGIHMKLSNFSFEELVANIHKILTDPKYEKSAKFASVLLREKRHSAAERASFLIEHVIKYGDAHLKTGAMKLSPLQFVMFDIYLVLTCLGFLLILLSALFVYCSFLVCRRLVFKRGKHKKD